MLFSSYLNIPDEKDENRKAVLKYKCIVAYTQPLEPMPKCAIGSESSLTLYLFVHIFQYWRIVILEFSVVREEINAIPCLSEQAHTANCL